MKATFVLGVVLCMINSYLPAQTTALIYSENFNSGPGGWVIGGFRPSWSHGIPSLPNISSNGTNCFTTGDAGAAAAEPFAGCEPVLAPTTTGNFYNCCERSFIESPVINLTGVQSPLLSLDINLHCEQTFDGAKVQVSTDGGINWQDVGPYTNGTFLQFPSALNCREQNWYNKNVINYLSGTAGGCSAVNINFGGSSSGWSGGCSQSASGACQSPDNHGTNGWITASHCIAQAANKPAVKLRIVFGAGSQVYSDGIAIDNVKIFDVYPVVSFTSVQVPGCKPVVEFTNTTDCAASWFWDFGQGNTSTSQDPVHEFPAAGSYTVSLSATDFCGGVSLSSQQVNVLPGNGPVFNLATMNDPLICDSLSGSISFSFAPPGTSPYAISYLYNNNPVAVTGLAGNPAVLTGLPPGLYSEFSIVDANGCEEFAQIGFQIPFIRDSLLISAGGDTTIKPGESANLFVSSNIPGNISWSPAASLDDPQSQNPLASPEVTTTYTVTVKDTNGCSASEQVTIYVKDPSLCNGYFFPNSFTPNGDGKNDRFGVYVDPTLNLASYKMIVFNRWGIPVFTTDTPGVTWNGSGAMQGLYVVVADFSCQNMKQSRYTGILNLIR